MNKILQVHRWKIHGIPGPKNKNKKPNQQFITLATDSNSDLFLNLKGVIHKNNPEFINSPGPSVQSPGPSPKKNLFFFFRKKILKKDSFFTFFEKRIQKSFLPGRIFADPWGHQLILSEPFGPFAHGPEMEH